MTRSPALSLDEICTRHKTAVTVRNGGSIPDAEKGSTIALATEEDVDVPIGATLTAALKSLRTAHDLEEVYVQSLEKGPFEPLTAHHFSHTGKWIAIARRRDPRRTPRIVGIMLAKDEADIIADVVRPLLPVLHHLYASPGDAETRDALKDNCPANWLTLADRPANATDGHRQTLLDLARADRVEEEDLRPMWVMAIQGDEVFEKDDLLHHVRLAEQERATVLNAQVPTFVLHDSQRQEWDWSLPLEQRLTHYVWGGNEHAGFLDHPWTHYRASEHMRAHPRGLYPGVWATARPVRRHYPFRNPDQARARIADRIISGWQPNYRRVEDVFANETTFGLPVCRYWGWFGEAERVEGIW